MEKPYKSIIDQRRALLVAEVTWSKNFKQKLRQAKLLPAAMLDTLELDANPQNRTFKLLARLVQEEEARVFQGLCDLLQSTGQTRVANLLLQDRDNIVWDFNDGAQINTIADFNNVLVDVLLKRLQHEEDPYIQAALTTEVKKRILKLTRFLQDTVRHHEEFLLNTLSLHNIEDLSAFADPVNVQAKQNASLIFPDALDKSKRKDTIACQHISNVLRKKDKEKEDLMGSIEQYKKEIENHEKELQEMKKQLEQKDNQSFFYLQKVIMDQDNTIHNLRTQLKSSDELVKFEKGNIIKLLSSIRNVCPQAAKLRMPGEPEGFGKPELKSEAALDQHLKALLKFTEQQKKRLVQNNNRLEELERERNVMKTLVNARGMSSLPNTLSQTLRGFREQKFEMTESIKLLRQKLAEVTEENDSLKLQFTDLTEKTELDSVFSGDGEPRTKYLPRKRQRSARRRQRAGSEKPNQRRRGSTLVDVENINKLLDIQGKENEKNSQTDTPDVTTASQRKTLITQYTNMQKQ